MKLSPIQKELLKRFGEEETIKHTRWVLSSNMSRAGGDANPRSFIALRDRRLIMRVKEELTFKDSRRDSVQHYRITDKARRILKGL